MFVTDYLAYPSEGHVLRVNMDGSGLLTLVSDMSYRPQGITADTINNKIIWADSRRDVIEMADYDGRSRYVFQFCCF